MVALYSHDNNYRNRVLCVKNSRYLDGAVTLIMTLILMLLSSMIIIFAANYGNLQSKSTANLQRHRQAFEAAQAGLEYGINYLQQNSSTILANPTNGYIVPYANSNITNVTLANNSTFTITYSNPVANNYDLIRISSAGTSDDGTASDTVSQLVEFGSLLLNIPSIPLTVQSIVSMDDHSEVINIYNNFTITSGSTVTLDKKAVTILESGVSSRKKKLKSDVTVNDPTLAGTSSNDLFTSYFGLPESIVQSSASKYYSNSSDTDYSSLLNGEEGSSIWIDQTSGTATISGTTTIGTSSNPVILVIKGNPTFKDNTTIYGFIYIDNPLIAQLQGNFLLVGGIVATGGINIIDSAHVMYSPFVLQNLQNLNTMKYFAKIPGSWKDF